MPATPQAPGGHAGAIPDPSTGTVPQGLAAADGVALPLLRLAVPITLSMLVQMAGAFMDISAASRHGMHTLGAVSVGTAVEALPVAFITGLTYLVLPAAGRLMASGQSDRILGVLAQGLALSGVLSLLAGLGALLAGQPLLHVFGVAPELVPDTLRYLYFVPAAILGNVLFAQLRYVIEACGKPLLVTLSVLAGLALKAVCLGLFAFGAAGAPDLGIIGFGLSALAYYAGINLCLFLLGRRQAALRGIWQGACDRSLLRPRALLAFAWHGLPVGANFLSDMFVLSAMGIAIAGLGAMDVGAHALAFNLLTNCLILTGAIAMAAAILVAQRSAVQPPHRLRRLAWQCTCLSLAVALPQALTVFLLAPSILSAYGADPALVPLALPLLRLFPWLLAVLTLTAILGFALRSLDDAPAVLVITSLAQWLVCLPLGLLLSRTDMLLPAQGALGWWVAYALSHTLAAPCLAWRLQRRTAGMLQPSALPVMASSTPARSHG